MRGPGEGGRFRLIIDVLEGPVLRRLHWGQGSDSFIRKLSRRRRDGRGPRFTPLLGRVRGVIGAKIAFFNAGIFGPDGEEVPL